MSTRESSLHAVADGGFVSIEGDPVKASRRRAVVQVWRDDDAGCVIQVFVGGKMLGEITFAGDERSAADDAFLAELARRGIPDVTRLVPARLKTKKTAKKISKKTAKKRPWSDATLALHVRYWVSVWNMNNFRLYNRYKKHLPAPERPEVDALCDPESRATDEEAERRVRSILERVWEHEDWDAVIRDPKLVDGDDPEWPEVKDWLAVVRGS